LNKFSERNFLVRALVGVFLIQFATVFYQIYSCQTAINSSRESDKVTAICATASGSFNETGKLALTTFLALLVPSSSQSVGNAVKPRRKSKPEEKVEESKDSNQVG
jgi:hypothetical protein